MHLPLCTFNKLKIVDIFLKEVGSGRVSQCSQVERGFFFLNNCEKFAYDFKTFVITSHLL